MNIVAAVQALFEGKVKAFMCLGGNLVGADVPTRDGWRLPGRPRI